MALLVILCCALVHISLAGSSVFLYHIIARSGIVIFLSCKAVSYLLYPLLGWMADVYFTRFKFVLFSFIATILGSILGIVTPVLVLQFPEHRHSLYYIGGGAIVVGLITMGLFESVYIYICVCVSSKNTAVLCLTARKSPRNSSLPLGLAIYIP